MSVLSLRTFRYFKGTVCNVYMLFNRKKAMLLNKKYTCYSMYINIHRIACNCIFQQTYASTSTYAVCGSGHVPWPYLNIVGGKDIFLLSNQVLHMPLETAYTVTQSNFKCLQSSHRDHVLLVPLY